MQHIVTWLGEEDQAVPAGLHALTRCRNADEFSSAMGSDSWDCGVVDLRHAANWLNDGAAHALACHKPLILRTSMSPAELMTLTEFGHLLTNARLSLHGHSVLRADIDEVIDSGGQAGPDLLLLRDLDGACGNRLRAIIPTLLALSRRRTSVRELSDACRVPVRTIEWLLQQTVSLTPRWFLGWGTALHTVWRMEVLGWSLKRAAWAAGAEDPGVLARYIERYTGQRPGHIVRMSGYDGLVTAWRAHLLGCPDGSSSRSTIQMDG